MTRLLGALACGLALTAAQPADPAALLKERDVLAAKAERLLADGKPAEAVAAARAALEKTRSARPAGHAEEADGLARLALTREAAGDFAAAVADRDAVVALRVKLHGAADWRSADAKRWAEYARLRQGLPAGKQKQLAAAEADLARFWPAVQTNRAAAADLATAALDAFREHLPAGHWRTGDALFLRGWTEVDRPAAADRTLREAAEVRAAALGADHPDTARARVNRSLALHRLDRNADALAEYEAALPALLKGLGEAHPETAMTANRLCVTQVLLNRYEAAKASGVVMVRTAKAAHGPASPEAAARLEFHGTVLTKLGEWAAAREALTESLAAFRGLRPPRHLDAARVLAELADAHPPGGPDPLAAFAARRRLYRDAVAEAEKAPAAGPAELGHYRLTAGRAGLAEGGARVSAGRPRAEADAVFREARADLETALGEAREARQPDREADAAVQLGLVAVALREDEAAGRWQAAATAALRRAGNLTPHTEAYLRQGIGMVARLRGDPAARPELEAALALFQNLGPAYRREVVVVTEQLAAVAAEAGRYRDARELYLRVLNAEVPVVGPAGLHDVLVAGRLADVEVLLGDPRAAMKHREAALERYRARPTANRELVGELELKIATEYSLLGERRARQVHLDRLRETAAGFPADHPFRAVTDLALALDALRDSDLPTGRRLAAAAATALRGAAPPYDGYYRWALQVRLTGERLAGDFAAAKVTIEEALAAVGKRDEDEPVRLSLLSLLGSTLSELGDVAGARARLAEAAAGFAACLPEGDTRALDATRHQARNEARAGDRAAATKFYAALIDGELRQADRYAAAQSEAGQLNHLADLAGVAQEYAFLDAGDDGYARLLRIKGAVTVRQRLLRAARDPADPEAKAAADALAGVNARLLSVAATAPPDPLARIAPGTLPPEAAAKRVERLSAERDRLERVLADRNPAYKRESTRPVPTPADVRQALPAGSALVDFYHAFDPKDVRVDTRAADIPRRLVAFITRADREGVVRLDLGDAAAVAKAVDGWRRRYASRDPDPKVAGDPAADLRRHVWEPVAKQLGGAKLVLVAPDGPLTAVPFAALPGAKAGTFLIEDGYTFVTVPVPQLLPALAALKAPAGPGSMLLVGDVDFGPDDRGPRFRRLDRTRDEVVTISRQYAQSFGRPADLLTRDAATKAAVLAAAPTHRFVHLATHGYFAEESVRSALDVRGRAERNGVLPAVPAGVHPGLLSGVAFAGVNADPAAGLLTALEAADLDLSGVEVAVLSACDSGRGALAGGEGPLGLQRALQVAGVRTSVATLWPVDDAAAQRLMVEFYRRLWAGGAPVTPAAALREAQLAALRAERAQAGTPGPGRNVGPPGSPGVPHLPYWWAGFVLAGDGR